ncbi:MAG: NHLP-related RiPP peptide [Arenimonas sp.]
MPNQISPEIAEKLLDKLSSDDEFRAVFQRSPRIALAYLGDKEASDISDADQSAYAHLRCDKLASAETIRASRDAMRKDLLSAHAALHPITLDIARKP